jgi:transcriptional regulatory protein LEU3
LLDVKQQDDIIYLVCELINALSSKDVALDGQHSPALYSQFLSSLLANCNPRSDVDIFAPVDIVSHGHGGKHRQTPPRPRSNTSFLLKGQVVDKPVCFGAYTMGQQLEESNVDFDIQHFMQTVSTGRHQLTPPASVNQPVPTSADSHVRWSLTTEQAWLNFA